MFDPDDIENDEDETSYGSRLSKKERRQKSKAKAKAEKLFNRQFGGDAGAPAQVGSRAAVYKGEMGRNHKRAFNDLGGSSEGRSARGGRHKSRVADKSPFERTDLGLCARHFDLHRRGSLVLVSYGAAVLRGFAHAR